MDPSASILERFGRRIRDKRTALGLSQEVFAHKCKLDRTYISGIERGKRNVALRNIAAIAKALDTTDSSSPSWLLCRLDSGGITIKLGHKSRSVELRKC